MFLDIKLGLLWALLVGLFFGVDFSVLWFAAGVAFALLPDIDFWVEYLERGTVGGKVIGAHRTLLHNPLPFIPVTLLIGYFFGPAWMTLFAVGVFGHFAHDLSGMGLGLRLFWPFSPNFHKFFSTRDGAISYRQEDCFVSWTPEEVARIAKESGNAHWIKEDVAYHLKRLPTHLLQLTLLGLIVLCLALLFKR